MHTILFLILFPSFLPPPPQPSAQDDLLAALLTCDVIVYDIVEDQTQVEEASWAVQGEGGEREGYFNHRHCSAPPLFLGRGCFFAFIPVVLMSISKQWKLGGGGG